MVFDISVEFMAGFAVVNLKFEVPSIWAPSFHPLIQLSSLSFSISEDTCQWNGAPLACSADFSTLVHTNWVSLPWHRPCCLFIGFLGQTHMSQSFCRQFRFLNSIVSNHFTVVGQQKYSEKAVTVGKHKFYFFSLEIAKDYSSLLQEIIMQTKVL